MRAAKEINIQTLTDKKREDHHYVPIFLLKNWCSGREKKMWWYYRCMSSGKVITGRISPKSTSFEPDLNMLREAPFSGVNDKNFAVVEGKSLKELDTRASIIMNKMLDKGIPSLTEDERKVWLNFVILLSDRNPDNLSQVELTGNTILDEVIDDAIRHWGHEKVWKNTAELLRKSELPYNYSRIRLHDLAKDMTYVEHSDLREWRIVDLSQSPLELFSSNLPVVAGIKKRHSFEADFLEMALTPKHLWLCAPRGFEFDNELIRDLVITYNIRLLRLHPKYVYSLHKIVDEKHIKYQKALREFLK